MEEILQLVYVLNMGKFYDSKVKTTAEENLKIA